VPSDPTTRLPSLSHRRRKHVAGLTRRRNRVKHGETIIESRRAIQSALDAGAPLVDAIVAKEAVKDAAVRALIEAFEARDLPVYVTDADTLADLTDVATAQGIVATVRRDLADAEDLPNAVGESGTVLLLDGVQDPGNVGTILRTAAWFGADAVVGGTGTAGFYHPKVMRAATGGHWGVTLARTEDAGTLLDGFRKTGFALYGADMYGTPAGAWTPRRPSVLILGSEAHGLSSVVLNRLDEPVAIPGAGREGVESLNVAIATGILVYEWLG